MSAGPTGATSITITLVTGAGAGPFTINIPAAVASAATVPGGVSPADSFVRNIFIRGGFWASDGKFYPASQIASIASA